MLGPFKTSKDCAQCTLHAEIKRLERIIEVMKFHVASTNKAVLHMEEHFRTKDGQLQVWGLDEWTDVEEEEEDEQ